MVNSRTLMENGRYYTSYMTSITLQKRSTAITKARCIQ